MRPSTAKAKGRDTETRFVDYLRRWVPHAERRRLTGSHDRGDIAGTPGICWEIKSGARLDLATWMHELEAEVTNDHAVHGALVIRPKGRPNPHDWWAVLTVPDLLDLLTEAGWIMPPHPPPTTAPTAEHRPAATPPTHRATTPPTPHDRHPSRRPTLPPARPPTATDPP